MPFSGLEDYLANLPVSPSAGSRVWLDGDGRAQGRYFNSSLTTAFQPVRDIGTGSIAGFEGFIRSCAGNGQGLCLWNLLDQAGSDTESVELDRLCRMLHTLNFFRQHEGTDSDLFLSVHARLLTAVDGDHGMAFRRVLDALELSGENIVLQLPAVTENQIPLLGAVARNYRGNGFRLAVNVAGTVHGLTVLKHVRPDFIKVDGRSLSDVENACGLFIEGAENNCRIIFKRMESTVAFDALARLSRNSGATILAQGFLWDQPQNSLSDFRDSFGVGSTPSTSFLRQDAA